jgi:nucleoside-diphosphate-sugar epimerase
MVEGLVRLMESDVEGPVNLGNPDEITIMDLAREVIDLAGSLPKLAPHLSRSNRSGGGVILLRHLSIGWQDHQPGA